MNAVRRDARAASSSLRALPPLAPATAVSLRRQVALFGYKWDAQVGDLDALAGFPLSIARGEWLWLAGAAERLTSEAFAAELEILERPKLMAELGLPRALRNVLQSRGSLTPVAGRVMRFDFHPTRDGWRISEVNADVPGGFSEASLFTRLMAAHYAPLCPTGDPGAAWCDVLASAASHGRVALLTAPGYLEDQQVVAYLARQLSERGCRTVLASPRQIRWDRAEATLDTTFCRERVDLLVRFYQAEWLPELPSKRGWHHFLRGGRTAVSSGAHAVVSESKRFALLWDRLSTPLPTWRELLPETRDPRDAPWARDDAWLLKSAFCNNGDTVSVRGLMSSREWLARSLSARLNPGAWVAQRRFESLPLPTPFGPRHVCIGVYTVNGRASGAYARLSHQPLIDSNATDVALLVNHDD
ncbi:MAG: glutathionylspermidine synthase family protein [Polyangiaceae bacterium]